MIRAWVLVKHRMIPAGSNHVGLGKIISGGQTGVDRAALDVALEFGISIEGWCPRGRRAEDGAIPSIYPLKETPSNSYALRTTWNVRDADGTLVLVRGSAHGGSKLTVRQAAKLRKPLLVIDLTVPFDAGRAIEWLRQNSIHVLNVAGSRESEAPGIHEQARDAMRQILSHTDQ